MWVRAHTALLRRLTFVDALRQKHCELSAESDAPTGVGVERPFDRIMREPEIKAKLVALGFYPVGVCGADFAAYLRRQYEEYGRVIREANIKGE